MSATVEISQGRLSGFEDQGLQVFLGIPFAKPPTGRLRFRPPEPPESWSGVRDATQHGCSAPQMAMALEKVMPGFDVGEQSEDCLYLNVYTPGADAARRPVMVWIHGGAYTLGSGSQKMYDVRELARPVLRHRIITNFHAEVSGVKSVDIVDRLLEQVKP